MLNMCHTVRLRDFFQLRKFFKASAGTLMIYVKRRGWNVYIGLDGTIRKIFKSRPCWYKTGALTIVSINGSRNFLYPTYDG